MNNTMHLTDQIDTAAQLARMCRNTAAMRRVTRARRALAQRNGAEALRELNAVEALLNAM